MLTAFVQVLIVMVGVFGVLGSLLRREGVIPPFCACFYKLLVNQAYSLSIILPGLECSHVGCGLFLRSQPSAGTPPTWVWPCVA
jgi:hypothetical protein